jgi:hypothetical protein
MTFIKQTPWSESTSEIYRSSDRRLLAKLVPIFAARGQRDGSLRPYSRFSRPDRQIGVHFILSRSVLFFFSS